MITQIVLILSVLSTALGFFTAQPLLVAAGCGASAFVACYLLSDLHRLQAYAARLAARSRPGAESEGLYRPLSAVALRVRENIQALICCTNINLFSGERQQVGDIPISDDELLAKVQLQPEKDLHPAGFYESILALVPGYFRAAAAAIIMAPEDEPRRWEVIGVGREQSALRSVLLHHAAEMLSGGSREIQGGLCDHAASRSLLADFSLFGYRYTIVFPFCIAERNQQRAMLWLAYDPMRPPHDLEVERARKLVRKIEKELSLARQVHDLRCVVQQTQHRLREKGEYISQISHDIRSPLNNVRSILAMLKIEQEGGAVGELIDVGLSNCLHLSELVEDILDYSKHQAGRLRARQELVDVTRCAEEIVESFGITAKLKGLTLQLHAPGAPCFAWVDRRHLKRIIANLVSNAIKYTPTGSVDVVLSSIPKLQRCSLLVRDSGIGMTEDQVDRLFQPFERMAEGAAEGAGLGLAVSKILIGLNGGEVRVSSRYRRGSEFEVVFPLRPAPAGRMSGSILPKSPQPVAVLLVDDNADFLDTLSRNLRSRGYQVHQAISVEDAMSICNFAAPHVIISDAAMPGGGAARMLEQLRNTDSAIPLLVLSGREDRAIEERYLRLGACAVLSKPVDIAELEQAIVSAAAGAGNGGEAEAPRAEVCATK